MRKNALITGSTSGIGLAIAEALARHGMNIVLNGTRAPEKMEQRRAALASDHSVSVAYCKADLGNPEDIKAMMSSATQEFGRIDVLVNNAGIQHISPIEDFPDESWETVMRVNLTGAFYTTKAVFAAMKAARWGRIINIASVQGMVGSLNRSAYTASKHGLIGLTKTAALEGAEYGITVNAICPGFLEKPATKEKVIETARERHMTEMDVVRDVFLAAQPIKQFVTMDQIAALAIYFCSDEATSITGTVFPSDGGRTAA